MSNAPLPYHLRDNAPHLCRCDKCYRKSWDVDQIDTLCDIPQPSGLRCNGIMRASDRVNADNKTAE